MKVTIIGAGAIGGRHAADLAGEVREGGSGMSSSLQAGTAEISG